MGIDPVTAGFDFFKTVIDKIWPDKSELEKQQLAKEMADASNSFELAKTQVLVNVEEAKNQNLFVSGWRPFVGWICAIGLGYNTLGLSLIKTLFALAVLFGVDNTSVQQAASVLPDIDVALLINLLAQLLGIGVVGALRTKEKIAGIVDKG